MSGVGDDPQTAKRLGPVTPGRWRGGHRCDGAIRATVDGERVTIGTMHSAADAAFVGQIKAMRDALLAVPGVPGMDEWWDEWGGLIGELGDLADG